MRVRARRTGVVALVRAARPLMDVLPGTVDAARTLPVRAARDRVRSVAIATRSR